jgi:DNA (cytosine-5)-methyltransferase 1
VNAYYNENDKFAAAWLRLLIQEKQIADGEVDERSIEEVQPEDLAGFTQCHFFAGIGIWNYALRCAGWPDGRPVWTGSCPCPSFSAAGQGKGFDDPRHLWPAWSRLIRECHPPTIFGEQVDDAIGFGWLDVVQTDLEREAYAVGKAVFGACSVGAPQIGQRLYFVAQATGSRRQEAREHGSGQSLLSARPEQCSGVGSMAASDGGNASAKGLQRSGEHGQFAEDGGIGELGAAEERGFGVRGSASGSSGRTSQSGPTNGFWADAEWLYCTDGKYRPVEPAPLGLANGLAADLGRVRLEDREVFFPLIQKGKNRVGRLRGYGNALCAPQAEEFVRAYMDIMK